MDLFLLLATGASQVLLAGLGFRITLSPIPKKETSRRRKYGAAFIVVCLLSVALTGITGMRSNAVQADLREAIDAMLHSGVVLPNQIRIVNQDRYDAVDTDRVLIVRKASEGPTHIYLPGNPKQGDSIEVKDGKGNASSNPIFVHGNGATVDGGEMYVLNFNRQEMGVWYDGQEWDLH